MLTTNTTEVAQGCTSPRGGPGEDWVRSSAHSDWDCPVPDPGRSGVSQSLVFCVLLALFHHNSVQSIGTIIYSRFFFKLTLSQLIFLLSSFLSNIRGIKGLTAKSCLLVQTEFSQ